MIDCELVRDKIQADCVWVKGYGWAFKDEVGEGRVFGMRRHPDDPPRWIEQEEYEERRR